MPAEPAARPDAETLARALREARGLAGISQRDLARRTGVAPATIAATELGGDPRWSTLRALRQSLLTLTPSRLLSDEAWAPAAPSKAAWRFFRDLAGFCADRHRRSLVLSACGVESQRLEITGVRPVRGSMDDATTRRTLLRALHRGDRSLLERALTDGRDRPGATIVLEEPGVRHEITLSRDPTGAGFDYVRTEERPEIADARAATGVLASTLGFPVVELELAATFVDGEGPETARFDAFPSGLGTGAGDEDRPALAAFRVAPELLADPPTWRVSVDHAIPYVSHELRWSTAEPARPSGPLPRLAPDAPSPAPVLRAARDDAGLSQRSLATLLHTSAATVRGAEAGLDVRRSTLVEYVQALPGLEPRDLLPDAVDPPPATPAEAWEYVRQLFGVEAEAETKHVQLDADGWGDACYRTVALRSLRPRTAALAVRYGTRRRQESPATPAPDVIEREDAPGADDDCRTRLIRRPDGQVIHELRFGADALRRGVTYRREVARAHHFALPAAGIPGGEVEGVSFAVAFPVGRLELSVGFPDGAWPADVRAFAWADALPPTPALPLPREVEDRDATVLRHDALRRTVHLAVTKPLLGVRWGIGWKVP